MTGSAGPRRTTSPPRGSRLPSWWPGLLLVVGVLEIGYALVSGRLFFLAGGLSLVAIAATHLIPERSEQVSAALDDRPWLMAAVLLVAIVAPIIFLAVDLASQAR